MDKEKLLAAMRERDRDFGYFGDLEPPRWGWSPIGQHRDSDILSQSNWQVVTKDLMDKFPEAFEIERYGHWAVGWTENLRIDTENEEAVDALIEWLNKLDDYPIASDDHFYELEQAEKERLWDSWMGQDMIDDEDWAEVLPGWDKLIGTGSEGRYWLGSDEGWQDVKWTVIDNMVPDGNSFYVDKERLALDMQHSIHAALHDASPYTQAEKAGQPALEIAL